MSAKNLTELIDEITQNSDLVKIISGYLNLKKSGRNFKALCPFHSEKTPSFMVSPDKQIWHCFGCGQGGNVFTFIMKIENLNFQDACKTLAEILGIPYREFKFDKEKEEFREKLFKINFLSLDYFQKNLKDAKNLIPCKYLKERGLKEDAIEKFKIGYAPSFFDGLQKFLSKEGISLQEMEKAGLISKSEKREGYFDWFRNRIIFPIFDLQNRIIGFSGRTLMSEEPKYINSKETSIFQKGKILYGLNFARNEITRSGYAIIVEGYLDLITSHINGVENVVASMGTSLTSEQANLISRFTEEVIIAYDPDTAGKSATIRGIEILFEKGLKIKVASLPEEKDPDILIREEGIDKFNKIIKEAKKFFDYRLDNLILGKEKIEPEDKAKIVEEISPYISKIKNQIVVDDYIKKISSRLNIDEKILRESVIKSEDKTDLEKIISVQTKIEKDKNKIERELIYLILTDGEMLKKVKERLTPFDFSDKECQKIADLIFKIDDKEEINPAKIINFVDSEETKRTISEILLKEVAILDNKNKVIQDYIKKIENNKLQKKQKEIQGEILKAVEEKDYQKERELLKSYSDTVRKLKYN